MSPDDPRHGTISGRSAHRRDGEEPCRPCKDAFAAYQRRTSKKRMLYGDALVSPHGAIRRIQALMCLGWTMRQIAERAGLDKGQMGAITRRNSTLQKKTHDKIARAFEEMCMTLPTPKNKYERANATKARRLAEKNGWVPPLGWDDIDHDPYPAMRMTARRRQVAEEAARYTATTARAAWSAYRRGDRSEWATGGYRLIERERSRRPGVGAPVFAGHAVQRGRARRRLAGTNETAPGGARTPLLQGPRRSNEEID